MYFCSDVNQVQLCLRPRVGLIIIHPVPHPTYGYFPWSSDIISLLMSFLPYVERDPSSPFLELEVLIMFHIVIFFIKSLGYSLASSNHYCLAPPAPSPM